MTKEHRFGRRRRRSLMRIVAVLIAVAFALAPIFRDDDDPGADLWRTVMALHLAAAHATAAPHAPHACHHAGGCLASAVVTAAADLSGPARRGRARVADAPALRSRIVQPSTKPPIA